MHRVTYWHLIFKDATSHKFYSVYTFDNGLLVLQWGRVGSEGQNKVDKFLTAERAMDTALRQVYEKAAKGYRKKVEALEFAVDGSTYINAQGGYLGGLVRAADEAMTSNDFTKQQGLVTSHYDQFIEQTAQVMDAASRGEDIDPLLARWEKLSTAWAELDDKHAHAQVAVQTVQQVVNQRLMGT